MQLPRHTDRSTGIFGDHSRLFAHIVTILRQKVRLIEWRPGFVTVHITLSSTAHPRPLNNFEYCIIMKNDDDNHPSRPGVEPRFQDSKQLPSIVSCLLGYYLGRLYVWPTFGRIFCPVLQYAQSYLHYNDVDWSSPLVT